MGASIALLAITRERSDQHIRLIVEDMRGGTVYVMISWANSFVTCLRPFGACLRVPLLVIFSCRVVRLGLYLRGGRTELGKVSRIYVSGNQAIIMTSIEKTCQMQEEKGVERNTKAGI